MQKVPGRILIVDDDPDILTAARVVLRQKFEAVETEQNVSRLHTIMQQKKFDVVLLDMNFAAGKSSGNEGIFWLRKFLEVNPDQKVILITAYGDVHIAVEGMKAGARDFIIKPWDNDKLVSVIMACIEKKKTTNQLVEKDALQDDLVGTSEGMKKVLDKVRKIAATDANVLLLGENGTGKEVVAGLIHRLSLRKDRPLVKVDLGALVTSLFESEMFGHKKGAFTDAREDKKGRFEMADGGTLFLDEIGNLPVAQQARLLSVLQSRQVIPVGSAHAVPIDTRIITATNSNLAVAVKDGTFREDLLYRINTIEIILPSLRERKEDIPLLAQHFLKIYTKKYNKLVKDFSPSAMEKLMNHSWPGNVRELSHSVERAVIMADSETLDKSEFNFAPSSLSSLDSVNLDELERKAILQSMSRNNGNMTKVARELGLGRTTLYRKLTKYGLDNPQQ